MLSIIFCGLQVVCARICILSLQRIGWFISGSSYLPDGKMEETVKLFLAREIRSANACSEPAPLKQNSWSTDHVSNPDLSRMDGNYPKTSQVKIVTCLNLNFNLIENH